jgi:hypothetical protein
VCFGGVIKVEKYRIKSQENSKERLFEEMLKLLLYVTMSAAFHAFKN